MTRQELINTVKTKVDELSPLDGVVSFIDQTNDKPIDNFADSLLDECAKEVLMRAPAYRLKGKDYLATGVGNKDGSGYVLLPDGFLRLLEFKMSEWKRSITEVFDSRSDIAQKQGNRYLRGGICKPVCVFGNRPEGQVIEYYSVKKKHDIERFVFVEPMNADELSVDLQDVVTWWCASRILEIVGKGNEAQMAYERGKSLL